MHVYLEIILDICSVLYNENQVNGFRFKFIYFVGMVLFVLLFAIKFIFCRVYHVFLGYQMKLLDFD